jgi:hypothetical protein
MCGGNYKNLGTGSITFSGCSIFSDAEAGYRGFEVFSFVAVYFSVGVQKICSKPHCFSSKPIISNIIL